MQSTYYIFIDSHLFYSVDQETFQHLHSLVEDDSIFVSRVRKPQWEVKYQLAAYLIHAGSESGIL